MADREGGFLLVSLARNSSELISEVFRSSVPRLTRNRWPLTVLVQNQIADPLGQFLRPILLPAFPHTPSIPPA